MVFPEGRGLESKKTISSFVFAFVAVAVALWLRQSTELKQSAASAESGTPRTLSAESAPVSLAGAPSPAPTNKRKVLRPQVGKQLPDPHLTTIQQFREYAAHALRSLPTQKPVQGHTDEEVHQMPQDLIDQVQPLAVIADAVQNNPAFKDSAYVFYQRCSEKEDLMTTVRAACLAKLRGLARERGINLNLNSYPKDVVDFSGLVPEP